MPPTVQFTEAQAERDLAAQLARLGAASTSWPTEGLRTKAIGFRHACEAALTAIETDPRYSVNDRGEPDADRKAMTRLVVQQSRVWLGLYDKASQGFETAYLTWDRSVSPTMVFPPAAHDAADALLALCNEVRRAVGSVKDDGSPELLACRKGAGIGRTVHKGAVAHIRDLGRDQITALAEPAADDKSPAAGAARDNRAFLLSLSVLIDAHMKPVAKKYGELVAELAKPLPVKQGAARDNLDLAQLKLEAIARRLLALLFAGGDAALRDHAESALPAIPYSQRKSDRAPSAGKDGKTMPAAAAGGEAVGPAPNPST